MMRSMSLGASASVGDARMTIRSWRSSSRARALKVNRDDLPSTILMRKRLPIDIFFFGGTTRSHVGSPIWLVRWTEAAATIVCGGGNRNGMQTLLFVVVLYGGLILLICFRVFLTYLGC